MKLPQQVYLDFAYSEALIRLEPPSFSFLLKRERTYLPSTMHHCVLEYQRPHFQFVIQLAMFSPASDAAPLVPSATPLQVSRN
ncbi:hypothetical protein H257_06361 [Aphanomyces astaci]|uniref:Uncharacterized protein n=1 Tax=Aphanomyces astaci TaxID=112090 RepID=W4GPG3_APHAT|nr:hypothetical protein H257_06358 [Aphanomyces astaci]XP_009829855.1 hypothetical protein H257_06359 [Aphanomyces astaci]XP_009829856.1 hypothetical protein H257_06360 [Aphanomyces astaci]XP_009829857.1 hypothetical protein H257_06361 [Aphanomyces astaci]ETV80907.1 hypothetical protein H257_06358 [Aphanomyces astaci]ETV80908.1 hypothetical protein H257_06359 [Aphanomyces astaci]ETV80909.1 hypothetical protein H257_06360 [Aphanomyces astaci]ETV80910.1 hypothetical protein H257_06361 [Aphanom|eukprot:XP_009829854.1 hypothetical protein H257_06358 [Aphanomyces astaci]